MSNTQPDLCYPVLTPFKFRGFVAKPPAFIQMSATEAREYQEAGVLGGDDMAALPPESETDVEAHAAAEAAAIAQAEAEALAQAEADAHAAAEAAALAQAEANAKAKPATKAAKATTKKPAK